MKLYVLFIPRYELNVIKRSMARIVVLFINGDLAAEVFKQINDIGMMADDYVWIVGDSITGSPVR